jgi:hypothetical protein
MGTLRGGQAEGLIVDAAAHVASGAVSVGGARLDAVRRAVAVLLTEGEAHPHTSEAMRRVALRVRGALARALGRGHAALARRRKVAAQLAIAHVAVLIAAAVLLARVRADAAACGEGSRVATAASSAISIRGASAAARAQRLGGYEEDHQAEMSSDLTVVHVEYPRLIPRRDVRHEYGPRNYRGKIVTREAASRQPFSRSEPEEAADRGSRGRERGRVRGRDAGRARTRRSRDPPTQAATRLFATATPSRCPTGSGPEFPHKPWLREGRNFAHAMRREPVTIPGARTHMDEGS